MKIFGWRPVTAASKEVYETMKKEHPILADIACFQSSHISHLTPRTLDISAAQEKMTMEGMAMKERIEGPPHRNCPILLQQTSFLALEEQIIFSGSEGTLTQGSHKARFSEIEERRAAVTLEGRRLYDRLLEEAMKEVVRTFGKPKAAEQDRILAETFKQYPDSWNELRDRQLVYFNYRLTSEAKMANVSTGTSANELIVQGVLEAVSITYEDFLPLSAAGIFQSNLGKANSAQVSICSTFADKAGYERALGCGIIDLNDSYSKAQNASLRKCAVELGLPDESFIDN